MDRLIYDYPASHDGTDWPRKYQCAQPGLDGSWAHRSVLLKPAEMSERSCSIVQVEQCRAQALAVGIECKRTGKTAAAAATLAHEARERTTSASKTPANSALMCCAVACLRAFARISTPAFR